MSFTMTLRTQKPGRIDTFTMGNIEAPVSGTAVEMGNAGASVSGTAVWR